ncbi:MAG: penicillin-binding protein 2 [Bryobacter sp.]|jgi:penicillin-binding protein 2|nr:penicillin-binding protein 2 [Bryobacter sp.]
MNLFPQRRARESWDEPNPNRLEKKFAAGKIAGFQYIAVGVFVFLLSGFWTLQVQDAETWSEMAEKNRIKALPLIAPRGKILDRDGRVIVDNHSNFSLLLSRENLKEEHIKWIAEGLNLDEEELRARIQRYKSQPRYVPVIIKEELTPGEISFVESHRDPELFPEMELIVTERRLYAKDGLAAQTIGYVGEISEPELNQAEYAKYQQGDIIGKTGIERQYNEHLMGVDGQRRVMVDNRGRERRVLSMKPAVPGKNLQLTIDLDVQVVAELALEGRRGAVVALDPRTGEVLAMVSRPSFDPNKFATRIRSKDWRELLDNPENPLLNRAIQAQLAPGSTFKPIMALAGLSEGVIDELTSFGCGGGASFYGRYFKCHRSAGHGRVALNGAIAQSCDVFFYNVGNQLGIDRIAKYATMTGLGQKTGIDLPSEAEGTVPSSEWKMRLFRQKWYAGETISVAIGQGALTVTPLQLAHAIGGITVGGVWHRPHLVKDAAPAEAARRADLNMQYVADVINGMYSVVNEGGTAGRARLQGIELCGKTGTAQLASNEFLKNTEAGRALKDTAWFVGFAPKLAPEIVVVAMWEAGEHGNLAAPIVRDVVKAYFDKKGRTRGTPATPPVVAQVVEVPGKVAP